jgi:3-deoxy-D-manno-octulosonic-acid transferase
MATTPTTNHQPPTTVAAPATIRWHLRWLFWSTLACLAFLPALLFIAWRVLVRRRPVAGLWAKMSGCGPAVAPGQVLVHGVSLGEVNLMRPLVPGLEAASGTRCLLTTSTTTGWEGLAKAFPERDRTFFPLDLPWAVGHFLRRTRPRAVILLESELWPVWLCACHARGIPVAGVNVRVSDRTFARLRRVRWLIAPFFAARAVSVAQNDAYAARLAILGALRIAVSGSMKADMVRLPEPCAVAAWIAQVGLDPTRPLLLLASTSDGEEATVLGRDLTAWQGWQIAICPRHPERGAAIAAFVANAKRTSLGERITTPNDVLIVDEIGRLGLLYAHAATSAGIAVVGGSLGSGRGGQNMLEAAAAGCATAVGWDVRSQPDPMALLRGVGGVVELTPSGLANELAALAADPARRAALGHAGRQAWIQGQGATARTMEQLRGFLD